MFVSQFNYTIAYFNPLEGLAEVVSGIAFFVKSIYFANFNPLEGLAEVVSWQNERRK